MNENRAGLLAGARLFLPVLAAAGMGVVLAQPVPSGRASPAAASAAVAARPAAAPAPTASAAASSAASAAASVASALPPSSAVDAESLLRMPVAAEPSATEKALIGPWEARFAADYAGPLLRYAVLLAADGTFRLDVRMKGADGGSPADLVNYGRWGASRGLFTTVVTRSADGKPTDLAHAGFAQVYALRSLRADGFSYQQLSTGALFEFVRAAGAPAVK